MGNDLFVLLNWTAEDKLCLSAVTIRGCCVRYTHKKFSSYDAVRRERIECSVQFWDIYSVTLFITLQETGSIFLQFSSSTTLHLEVIFEVLEEYDWTAFSVVSTRHHGYQDFLSVVEGLTDGSFIGWEKKSVVMLNLTDDPGGARTRRLLKENEAQVLYEREREREKVNVFCLTYLLTYLLTHSFNHSLTLPLLIWHHFLSPLALCLVFCTTVPRAPFLSDLSPSFLCSPLFLIPFPVSTYICVMCVCRRLSSVSPCLQAVIVWCVCVRGVIVPCGSQYIDVSVNITQSLWRCSPVPYALDSVCNASAQLHTHTEINTLE